MDHTVVRTALFGIFMVACNGSDGSSCDVELSDAGRLPEEDGSACLAGNCVDCAPGATRCEPSHPLQYLQLCGGAGTWGAATNCFASDQMCLYNAATGASACGGSCAPGIPRCTPSGESQDCSTTGTLMTPVACDAASQICNKQTGLCAANPILSLGRHLAADGTNTRALPSRIYATPIRTTDAVRLLELGVLTSDQSSGGFAMMAIYRDTVISNLHRPGALLAYTIETGLWSNTANTLAPEDTTVVLEANTTYWLAVVQDGASVSYRQYAATPSAEGTGVYVEAGYSWPDNFPATFPSPAYMSGFELSGFARVQRIWQP